MLLLTASAATPRRASAIGVIEQVSQGSRDSRPDLAYNPAQSAWLVVWREADPATPTTARIVGRLVHRGGLFVGSPVQIEGFRRHTGHPRIAFDGNDGWIVVWVGGNDPVEPSSSSVEVRAKRVSRIGAPFSSVASVSPTGRSGEANASVFVGETRSGSTVGRFALVVWEEIVDGRRSVWARNLSFTSGSSG
ncbi:MAG TPA: hypothetical protein VK116_06965, partial [Planctomycetota bacterium]|nr:hypothetical protein [Planctomycetota bacterium]